MQTTQNNYNYGRKFRKYTYSSIPISFCILALLLLNSGIGNRAHAVNTDHETTSNNTPTPISYPKDNPTALTHAENMVDMGGTDSADNTNYTISRAVSPSTSLTIATPNLSTIAPVGEVSYLSSNVTYSANDIESYSLKISYASGSNALKGDSSSASTITGAGGKTPASMSSNTWGYALADTNANNTTLTYNTMPAYGSGTTIVSGNAESVPTTTKKLVFASKFAESATSGHYRTKVLLSLTATPKGIAVTGFGGIQKMQDMTANICNSVTTGTTGELYDTRDESIYTVAKLKDGKCWMTQNLRLALNRTLTPSDSNVSTPWPSSPLTSGIWTIEPNGPSGYEDGTTADYGYNKYKSSYGFFYGWCALTAGDCPSKGTAAKSSICPKGWTIPSDSQYNSATSGITATSLVNSPFFFVEVGVLASDNAKTWEYRTSGKHYTTWTNTGGYWSSKVISGAPEVYPSDDYYEAYSVRCVTSGS